MARNEVGTIVVIEGSGANRVLGVVTDRDITIRCVAAGFDPDTTHLQDLMTTPVHSVTEQTPIEDALARMASAGTRRLVVTDQQGRAVGLLSMDDVLDLLIEEAGSIGRVLEKQRASVPA
jgi:CBS domain-containing protein